MALAAARFRAEVDGEFDPSPNPLARFDRGSALDARRRMHESTTVTVFSGLRAGAGRLRPNLLID